MESNLPQTVALLTNTPAALNALLRTLPDAWTHHNEGPGTWSIYDVILHLNHNERVNWIHRARIILDHGENHTFTPLDREAGIGMPRTQTLPQLLDEFSRLRAKNLQQLAALNLTPHDLARRLEDFRSPNSELGGWLLLIGSTLLFGSILGSAFLLLIRLFNLG